MRAVIQRTDSASVSVNQEIIAETGKGMLIFLGIEEFDNEEDIDWICGKIARLRIFSDHNGIMNLDVQETKGEVLIVSQFTLHASTKKGNRPSYIRAARPEKAVPLYHLFIQKLQEHIPTKIKTGSFGAMMKVQLINDGPVTILIDTKQKE